MKGSVTLDGASGDKVVKGLSSVRRAAKQIIYSSIRLKPRASDEDMHGVDDTMDMTGSSQLPPAQRTISDYTVLECEDMLVPYTGGLACV